LDEMIHVAKEMRLQNINIPLLIGGATTSRVHTAVKVQPEYAHGVIHVLDASKAVPVVEKLINPERQGAFKTEINDEYEKVRAHYAKNQAKKSFLSIEASRKNECPLDLSKVPALPKHLGTTVFENVDLETLVPFIDWTPFFRTWELHGKYPQILNDEIVGESATKLFEDAKELLNKFVRGKSLQAHGIFGLFEAQRTGPEEVSLINTPSEFKFQFLRQQQKKHASAHNISLADFIAPQESGIKDCIGCFAVSTGFGLEKIIAEFEADHDDYNSILAKALADRLAEAFAEYLHLKVRVEYWGYNENESLKTEDLIAEDYPGIRPAPGYPACPDHLEKNTIWELLQVKETIGIELTESLAMYPTAAVSGYYFGHPDSKYFGLGKISRDQVEDYAERRKESVPVIERWLSSNLNYQ
jgi:5-methyltetrahydrofolate--homocysteine methyltransferase